MQPTIRGQHQRQSREQRQAACLVCAHDRSWGLISACLHRVALRNLVQAVAKQDEMYENAKTLKTPILVNMVPENVTKILDPIQ